eukprot:TRINITY_DN15157_c0_g1_i1.p1 TRINITY_DN15157_c0_g1~~TRINITY_DN15157_c0_g1_i1.p1  ORF type:complete len:136 (+),score=13.37 TRINITY_DN15157_c0_g1_i1:97-504(+)
MTHRTVLSTLTIFLILCSFSYAANIILDWNQPAFLHTRVNIGDTVTWRSEGHIKHTVTSTDHTHELDSDVISSYPSSSFSHTFTKAGNYHYTSKANNKEMLGTVIVSQDVFSDAKSLSSLFLAAVIAALLAFVLS